MEQMEWDVRLSASINDTGARHAPQPSRSLSSCLCWGSCSSELGLLTGEHESNPDVTAVTARQLLC